MARTLSEDVRLVIDTLGFVIHAQGGSAAYEAVETIRLAAKEAREADEDERRDAARGRLAQAVRQLDPATALEVARAFTLYFQLVNLAEDAQRARELRRRETAGGPASVGESIHAVMAAIADAGLTRDDALRLLSEIRLTFVFTAHPTEARRQTTERLLAEVARVIRRRDRLALTGLEVAATDRRLRAAIEALFQHAAERTRPPDVLDEVSAGLWYFQHVLLDVVPRFQRRLRHAFEERFGPIDPLELPIPIRFGSWMGGDRDGNPHVTPEVTARTLELHRGIVLDRYERDLRELVDAMAGAADRLPADPALDAVLARTAEAVPELASRASERNPHEPLRRLVSLMAGRVQRTRSASAGGYRRPEAFLDDLLTLRDALRRARAKALPDDALLDLIQRVRCFGFHLAALDVREDSRVHREAVAHLVGDTGYASAAPAARIDALGRLSIPPEAHSKTAAAVLELFATMRRLQHRYGPEAIGAYVISMTESAADVLEVLRLAELHGIGDTLDIVPLLETPDDLARAGALLDALLTNDRYRRHLERRGRRQELLVGYSDSMKQGGMLASRVAVGEAQRAAAAVCRRHKVRLRVFHGRGGSVSRGGGPTHRAILALPPEAFGGEARITEQGEMRAHNFANPDLAVRYLEQSVGAAIELRCECASVPPSRPAGEAETLAALATAGRRAYRAFVDDPRLVPYFRAATPFEHISALNIGSRPARRAGADDAGVSSLRAIPWVFSWSQSRHVLTGWFGVGSAFAAVLDEPDGETRLQALYRSSRFLRDLVDNVEMALSKADLPIAARYASLCPDQGIASLFDDIVAEYDRTVAAVLRVTGRPELLADDPVLARSIRLRNPYVDPLSYLQVEALGRLRGPEPMSDGDRAAWARVVRLTVQGIAAGIRHTG